MSEQAQIQQGQLVTHKTGGPVMAVDAVMPIEWAAGQFSVACSWWANSEFQTAEFGIHSVVPFENEQP